MTLVCAEPESIDSLGYIGLGIGTNNDLQDWWQYSPATNTWTQKADFAGGQTRDVVSFSIGSYGYVATGGTNCSNQLWRYDPSSNSWIQKANFGGTGRQLAAGFAAGGKGYVGTGFCAASLNDFWEYDPVNNSWMQKAGFPGLPRWAAACFSIGNKGYIGMGSNNFNLLQDFWEYNTLTNQWSQKADYGGGAIYYTSQFTIGNKGYVVNGMDQITNFYSSLWEYTPDNTTSSEEISPDNYGDQFTIFPNPAKELLVISLPRIYRGYSLIGNEKLNLTITDVRGNLINLPSPFIGSQQLTIDIHNLSKGIYFVTIDTGKEKTWKKFVKE